MRRLLNTVLDWLYRRSPARIPELMDYTPTVARVQDIESRLAALEAMVDRFVAPRLASREILRLLSHLPEDRALALVKETAERMKAEGKL